MSWVKLDDAMGEHRKVKRALRKNRPAIALHFLGILHCSRYLTDGFVEDEYIDEVLPARERAPALTALVEHGMWEQADGGYRIHDYLAHNPTRAKVLAQRAADAARKARGRGSDSRGKPDAIQPESGRTPDGIRAESVRPVPSRPVPTTPRAPQGGSLATGDDGLELPIRPSGSRQRDKQLFDEQVRTYAAARFPDLPEPERSQAVRGALTADATHASVEAYVRRWLSPPGETDDKPALTDKQRDAIHTVGNRITEINDNATEAA